MSSHSSHPDSDLDLGENDVEEDFSYPPSERKLYTQPVDLSVHTLVEQWRNKTLVLPEIQREYVWDNGKASRLIESLLLNIPIPVLYFAETQDAKYEIIDGHQRVSSIARFLGNEFTLSGLAVLREYRNLPFHKLPDREQRFLTMRTLRAIIISVESHPNMKFEVFERLNTGAISLNAQELRNSLYRGSFNRLLRDLVKNPTFREVIGPKQPRKRMVDEELVLRFFALRERLVHYRPSLKRFLNSFMNDVKDATEEELAAYRDTFDRAIKAVERLIGQRAFRMTNAKGELLETTVNRALFDAQMLTCSWVSSVKGASKGRVGEELTLLASSSEFMDAIQRATGDRSRTLRRVRDTVQALRNAGLQIDVPIDLSK
jgi:hypothetical protein